jgi:uncharacterized protein (TIGR03083 family)
MTESTTDPLFAATMAERRRLVGLLSDLSDEQWAHASLCDRWRVREVVAHITTAYRLAPETVMAELEAAEGDWNVACDVLAKRDTAQHSDAELLASLAANIAHPWQPPHGGQAGALNHDVIHGLDITESLGLPRPPTERVGLVLANIDERALAFFGVDLTGRRLVASDFDWSLGEGPSTVEAPAAELLLAIAGRRPFPDPDRRH